MLVVSLNIRHGGGRRSKALLDWTQAHAPDVIVFLEWRDNLVGNDIKTRIEESGLFAATAAGQTAKSNGILVASKAMIDAQRITPKGSDKGELLLVNIGSKERLLAAYFPGNKAKAPFFQTCMAEALKREQMPFLLLGDLNTGRNDLDIEGNGAPFYCADLFQALEDQAGLIDLWRRTRSATRVDLAISTQWLSYRPCFWKQAIFGSICIDYLFLRS